MPFLISLPLFLIFLVGAFLLQNARLAVHAVSKLPQDAFSAYRRLQRFFFGPLTKEINEQRLLFLNLSGATAILRFAYAFITMALFLTIGSKRIEIGFATAYLCPKVLWPWMIIGAVIALLIDLIICEWLPRRWVATNPQKTLQFFAPCASPLLYILSAVTLPLLKLCKADRRRLYPVHLGDAEHKKAVSSFDAEDRKLLASAATFQDRIVREIMIPRTEVFSLSAVTSIREAAQKIKDEGYSRIPVYQQNLDNIVGLILYKDLLNVALECVQNNQPAKLDHSIETLIKPILFTPKTSKVSHLLHEFRRKQTHLAIVVDEYGGTEGLVTIEDCLEEIVGEIADEYDEEEGSYISEADGGWIVDAGMSLLDIEDHLGVKIPQSSEYDTLAGYVAFCAGEIPTSGVIIHHDDFELEILEADERSIKTVRLRPIGKSERFHKK
jgi:putative hemolysin